MHDSIEPTSGFKPSSRISYLCLSISILVCLIVVGSLLLAMHLSSIRRVPCSVRSRNVTYASKDYLGNTVYTAMIVVEPLGYDPVSTIILYPAIVWAHGGWNRGTDLDVLCRFSDMGWVGIGPFFQGSDGIPANKGKRDFMGSMLDDIDGALEWAVVRDNIDNHQLYLAGDELGGAAVLRYLNEIGLDGDVERLQKAAVSNPIFDGVAQLSNAKWMDQSGNDMLRDLQALYGFNSSEEVIEGILRARSPTASKAHILDSVFVSASADNEMVSFTQSTECAMHLSTLPQQFRYMVYSNKTALDWKNGRFLKDMMSWFKNEQVDA